MSDTPRTDRCVYKTTERDIGFECIAASVARKLERELAEAKDETQSARVAWQMQSQQLKEAERRLSQGSIPEGWKLVPIEPTRAMTDAYKHYQITGRSYLDLQVWKAMLAAAPEAPKEGT